MGLPDSRIEKTALTMKKQGHELLFLGGRSVLNQDLNAFGETHHVSVGNNFALVVDPRIKKRWIKKIDEIRPDVVHAHNIVAAAMMLDTPYPVVYDDHEYWSKQMFKFTSRDFLHRVAAKPLIRAIPRWERRLLESYPVLTVSEGIAENHRRYSSHVEITRNFPSIEELLTLENHEDREGNVYVGNDFNLPKFLPHRNMASLRSVIDLNIIMGLPHDVMMECLTHYRIGLTPWRPHAFHRYCDPNKHYEYLNAGLQVIVTHTLHHALVGNPYVHTFSSYEEIPHLIDSLPDICGSVIMEDARERYIWENHEGKIRNIYKYASPSFSA
jgi:hypothetical protein